MGSKDSRKNLRKIAYKRMNILFKKAFEVYKDNPELARRYIYLLWRIKLKAAIPLPKKMRNKFCKKCFTPWIPGETLRIRVRNKKIIYTCLYCGTVKRFPIKKT